MDTLEKASIISDTLIQVSFLMQKKDESVTGDKRSVVSYYEEIVNEMRDMIRVILGGSEECDRALIEFNNQ